MKKKLIKIFMVICIAFNFFINAAIKANASELEFIPWYVYLICDDKWYVGDFVTNPTSSWGTALDEGSRIQKLRIETMNFSEPISYGKEFIFNANIHINGIKPRTMMINYVFYDSNGNGYSMTFTEEQIQESLIYTEDDIDFTHNVKIKFTNDSNVEYVKMMIDYNFIESANVLMNVVSVKNEGYAIVKSSSAIEKENNENISGIFETVKAIFTGITEMPSKIATSVKGFFDNVVSSVTNMGNLISNTIKLIEGWLEDLLSGIVYWLKSLFIPSDDYFKNYFDSLYDFFSEKLGILIMPFDILISFMNNILNLGNGDGYIHIPNIKFMDVNLIPKTDYNLKKDMKEVMGNYYDMYYLLTDVIIYFMLFNMAKKKFDEIVRGTN